LAASFGGSASSAESVIGTRQAGNLLTRGELVGRRHLHRTVLVLSLASGRARRAGSVLDRAFTPPQTRPRARRPVGRAPPLPFR
jgi:preprotein translocase subunit SecG